jgi:hypothetical protein
VYRKCYIANTTLWVSFDYGKNFVLREVNIGQRSYCSANVEGIIYRTGFDGCFKSEDYGVNFELLEIGTVGGEMGLQKEEVFGLKSIVIYGQPTQYKLIHTYNVLAAWRRRGFHCHSDGHKT